MADDQPTVFSEQTTPCPACGTPVYVPRNKICVCPHCGEVFEADKADDAAIDLWD